MKISSLRKHAFTSSAITQSDIRRVTVIGSGQMGSGIAQVAAMKQHEVTLVDVNQEALERGKGYMSKSLKRVAKKKFPEDAKAQNQFVEKALGHVTLSTNASKSVSNAGLVVEAVVENLKAKQNIFVKLAMEAPDNAILASNTSSLPIAKIAAPLTLSQRKRFIGLHFFNPVPQMKLVEVVRSDEVDQKTVDDAVAFVKSIGKTPAVCKDTPGFIVNRLLLPYMMESIRLLESGVASARDIDTAMKLGAGYPMGPFELCDYVGLDTIKFIVDGWYKEGAGLKGNKLFESSKKLDELVQAGSLGVKSGKGFYDY
ncbi:hydroxyacyl-coenzyme A dehydrogenase [Coemansia reversa NRRL 1564]|uniref:3-hydroxyacyl-CoA dehydrogenase n=1 Tax=Coemansia reversa (strain ATCC 12441 / NRRL 1564) TaxID=763665 RepID=A0A2G5B887_COERN|nr:hydroxyacyl-coenzyme A dehydrogenase [Coemansia reversa NRRL 1564]|eukprot:PIA15253.1 hydroxyacyl-coenzyme A dehydrogenase [Coemansia reversa NRRL 1564]